MQHERTPAGNPAPETFNDHEISSTQPERTQEEYGNLGQSIVGIAEANNTEISPDLKLKMVKNKIQAAEQQLQHTSNTFVNQNNDLWRKIEGAGFRPSNSSEYKDFEQKNKEALTEAVDQTFQNLINELSPHMNDRELGKLCGETTGTTGFINHLSEFHHFSKEGKIGLMETFDFYDFSKVFEEKGVDIYEQINEQIFDNQLVDDDDMSWDIRSGRIISQDGDVINCIYVGQSFREDQYDTNGEWSGEQWFSGNGGIYIPLNNFSDAKLNGTCSNQQKKMLEVAKQTTAHNVFNLIDGGVETLIK